MRTLITFPLDAGIIGELEFIGSADIDTDGEDLIATNARIEVYVPGEPGKHGHTLDVTHLISTDEIENITEKIMAAYLFI